MIKPKKLQAGDTVAAVSLSWGGPGTIPHRYEAGKRQLQEEFGLKVTETAHALREEAWLHNNPKPRAEDLMNAFADPSIKAIISTIGGDDSIRILPYLDLDVIRSNPKIFMGFSDTTITHLACFKAGVVSFYGPSIMAGFGENAGLFPFMVEAVRRSLFSSAPIGNVIPNTDGWTAEALSWAKPENQSRKRSLNPSTGWKFIQGKGVRQGHLLGGCIEVLDFLRGTDFWPDSAAWQDAILFLETSEEAPPPHLVKYILRSYASMGVLKQLSGILFGRPGGNIPVEQFKEYDEVIFQVVTEEEGLSDLPIITNMDFGHTDPVFVLPYGVQAEIDCEAQQFRIVENAVID
ncbi:MAG TPA: S66 peptidase family protein [Anaerolineales bacterium]|jgi:muramoyltetrapeptide carboxypeptidase LdcA involved in peptidoglycan recycling|nr:S66 peptidase family protein [Anaerolineales bacterium]